MTDFDRLDEEDEDLERERARAERWKRPLQFSKDRPSSPNAEFNGDVDEVMQEQTHSRAEAWKRPLQHTRENVFEPIARLGLTASGNHTPDRPIEVQRGNVRAQHASNINALEIAWSPNNERASVRTAKDGGSDLIDGAVAQMRREEAEAERADAGEMVERIDQGGQLFYEDK